MSKVKPLRPESEIPDELRAQLSNRYLNNHKTVSQILREVVSKLGGADMDEIIICAFKDYGVIVRRTAAASILHAHKTRRLMSVTKRADGRLEWRMSDKCDV